MPSDKAEADHPRVVGVLAALQVHDVQAPHEVVEAPPAGAPGDDLARSAVDVEMGVVVIRTRQPFIARRSSSGGLSASTRVTATTLAVPVSAPSIPCAASAAPNGGSSGRWPDRPTGSAVGKVDFPARPVGPRLQRHGDDLRRTSTGATSGPPTLIGFGGAIRCSPRLPRSAWRPSPSPTPSRTATASRRASRATRASGASRERIAPIIPRSPPIRRSTRGPSPGHRHRIGSQQVSRAAGRHDFYTIKVNSDPSAS